MVANLTRFSACKVHPDTPDKPVRERPARSDPPPVAEAPQQAVAPDVPVRLFAWVSA